MGRPDYPSQCLISPCFPGVEAAWQDLQGHSLGVSLPDRAGEGRVLWRKMPKGCGWPFRQQQYRQGLLGSPSQPTPPHPSLTPSSVWSSAIQVNKLKREMVHLQHELQFKERGFQTLKK